jgi:muconolactone delta-isomerase
MPLRIWRRDEVRELTSHPNDPAPMPSSPRVPQHDEASAEFLVTFTPAVPEGTPAHDVEEATAREAERASELAKQGHLARLWVRPAEHGVSSALGLWRAGGGDEMQAILESLPLYPYVRTRTTPLSPHPSDPAASATLRG